MGLARDTWWAVELSVLSILSWHLSVLDFLHYYHCISMAPFNRRLLPQGHTAGSPRSHCWFLALSPLLVFTSRGFYRGCEGAVGAKPIIRSETKLHYRHIWEDRTLGLSPHTSFLLHLSRFPFSNTLATHTHTHTHVTFVHASSPPQSFFPLLSLRVE